MLVCGSKKENFWLDLMWIAESELDSSCDNKQSLKWQVANLTLCRCVLETGLPVSCQI